MRVTKYECAIGLALVVITGCASGGEDEAGLGSGGSAAPNFSNVAGQGSPQSMAGAPAPAAGSGGTTNNKPSGTGGSAQPQAGKGGASGTGMAGMGAAGSSGAAGMGSGGSSGAAGMDDSGTGGAADDEDPLGLGGLLPTDDPNAGNAPPPAAGMCADAVCFDVFDCYLWHADIVDCGFTDCVDFVCQ